MAELGTLRGRCNRFHLFLPSLVFFLSSLRLEKRAGSDFHLFYSSYSMLSWCNQLQINVSCGELWKPTLSQLWKQLQSIILSGFGFLSGHITVPYYLTCFNLYSSLFPKLWNAIAATHTVGSQVPEELVPHISCDAFHVSVTLLKSGNENPHNDWTPQVYQHFLHSHLCPFGTICNNRQSTKSNLNLGMSQSARR